MREFRTWVATAAIAALPMVIGGCGGEASDMVEEESRPDAAETQPEEPQELELTVNEDGETVRGRSILLTGTVSEPGAEIGVDDEETTARQDGSFRVRVGLPDLGSNRFFVTASKPGFEEATESITVTRRRTRAEIQAARERRRLRRQQELAQLRQNAQAIPPRQLQKNPDRYAGDPIVISGEIFQIQEGGGENFFLMNTECETEFDITICDGPSVYVTYDFSIPHAEEDLVTVYGEVQGGYEYDTQAGGSNFVAHVEAEIIE